MKLSGAQHFRLVCILVGMVLLSTWNGYQVALTAERRATEPTRVYLYCFNDQTMTWDRCREAEGILYARFRPAKRFMLYFQDGRSAEIDPMNHELNRRELTGSRK